MKKPECSICFEEFDEKEKFPHTIKNCGHSFCKECILSMMNMAQKEGRNQIKCPRCFKFQQFAENVSELEKSFPKNFLFSDFDYFKVYQLENCTHKKKEYFCIDQDCLRKTRSCLDCWRNFHDTCDEKLTGKVSQIKVDFSQNLKEVDSSFDLEKIKNTIRAKVKELEDVLINMVEEFQKVLQKEIGQVSSKFKNIDDLKKSDSRFSIHQIEEEEFKFEIKINSWTHLERLSTSMKNYVEIDFFRDFWESFSSFNLKNLRTWKKLEQDDFRTLEEFFKKYETGHPKFVSSVLFGGFQGQSPFEFHKFFKEAEKYEKVNTIPFIVVDSKNIHENTVEFFENIIFNHLNGQNLSFEAIEDGIKREIDGFFPEKYFVEITMKESLDKTSDEKKWICFKLGETPFRIFIVEQNQNDFIGF